jgi:FkbM family methyltransferase
MKNYVRVFAAVYIYCENWLHIFLHKVLGVPMDSIKMRNGLKFFTIGGKLGKADLSMFAEIWFHEFYNPPFFPIKENDIVFDVGANNGYFTIYAAQKAKSGKVYAFEPVSALADLIRKNAAVNRLDNIQIEQFALGGKSGEADFFISKQHNGCHSLYHRAADDEPVRVRLLTLADFCAQKGIVKIDFLKMDCEGAEYEILLNLDRTALSMIGKIAMEHHDDILAGRTHGEIVDFLQQHNFLVAEKTGYIYALNRLKIV